MKIQALPKNLFLSSKGILAVGTVACLLSFPVHSATFGHARLDSSSAAGLDIRIPINQLSKADIDALSASAAPAEQWQAYGLTPPVELSSLRFNILATGKKDASILQVLSDQPYQDSIIDLLLNVTTASGVEPYQVSLVVPPRHQASSAQPSKSAKKDTVGTLPQGTAKSILVKPGDNMFAIAKRNAVDGVSVYQMMMALHRTNPQAFIKDNVNLVKAGASLDMPGMQELLAISDAQARRQFVAHTNALASGTSPQTASNLIDADVASSGQITSSTDTAATSQPDEVIDRVKLGAASDTDAEVSAQHALEDTKIRVSQLEDNVKNLNQALQSQGRAASDLVTDGAKLISDSFEQIDNSANGASNGTNNTNGNTADQANDQPAGKQSASAINSSDTAKNSTAVSGLAGSNNSSTDGNTGDGQTAVNSNAGNNSVADVSGSATETRNTDSPNGTGSSSTGSDNKSAAGTSGSASNNQSSSGIDIKTDAAKTAATASTKADSSKSPAGAADRPDTETSWLAWADEHVFGLFLAAMAIMVLILVWLLRILNRNRDKRLAAANISDEQLQAKLDEIDLNLDSDDQK